MARAPRWLRSVRYRPTAFVALVLLSASAVLVSAITPMLLGALNAATVREGFATARTPNDGVSVTARVQAQFDVVTAQAATAEVLQAVEAGSARWSDTTQVLEAAVSGTWIEDAPGGGRARGLFSIAPVGCEGIRLVEGRCPKDVGEAAVPLSLTRAGRWPVGSTFSSRLPDQVPPHEFAVVGVYDDTDGAGAAQADPASLIGAQVRRATPDMMLGPDGMDDLQTTFELTAARRLLRPVTEADVPGIRRGLAAAVRAASGEDGAEVAAFVRTGIPDLLDGIAAKQRAATTLAAPIGLEALVLAWVALGAVAQRTARSRAVEWGIGRTRGDRLRERLAAVFLEPVAAVLLGAVVGYLAAIGVATAAGDAVLGTARDASFLAPLALAVAGLALLGSLVTLVAASAGAALQPLDELLRDTTERRRAGRPALVGRIVVLSLTAAVLWATFTGPLASGPQLALLLPVLVALVVGLAAVQLAVLLVRRGSRRPPRSLTALVVGRGLARAPSGLATARLVLVGAALAAYVLQVQAVSAAVQTDRAELAVGAPRVLTVAVPASVSLLDLVDRADPSGRAAMAAAELDGTGAGRVVAVDSRRLPAVSSWRNAWRGGADLGRLGSATQDDLVLRGQRLSVSFADVQDGVELAVPQPYGLTVTVRLATADDWADVDLGRLADRTRTAAIPCAAGCRLISVGVKDANPAFHDAWGTRFAISAVATDRQSAASLRPWLRAARWRDRVVDDEDPSRPARATPTVSGEGLGVIATDRSGVLTAELEPASGPATVPAVVAGSAGTTSFAGIPGAFFGSSLTRSSLVFQRIATAPALPRTLRDGVLVDLREVLRNTDTAALVATQEVWLAAGAHPAVLAALRSEGVRVVGEQTSQAAVAAGLRSATNRALVLAGATAAGAVLLALLALAAAWIIDGPARRRDQQVLRLAGIPPARVRRVAFVQLAAPSAVAVLAGIASGMLAAALTVARLPLLVGQSAGPPVDATPPFAALGVLAVVMLVLIVAAAAVASRIDLGRELA